MALVSIAFRRRARRDSGG